MRRAVLAIRAGGRHDRDHFSGGGLVRRLELQLKPRAFVDLRRSAKFLSQRDLTEEQLADNLAAGKNPKPGPQIDRQFSAPVGGPTTLKSAGK